VYTGSGKGKTTAAVGAVLRAAGQGLRVLIIQFMKGQRISGEIKALDHCGLPVEVRQFGRRVFFKSRACEPMDRHMAAKGLADFENALESRRYDMIVLDEINMAVAFDLIAFEDLKRLLQRRPPELHLILTGRKAKKELIEMADLVTEMGEVKHPYHRGVRAQVGIEY
jgi:cob(I)alamin adenosyltransferase